MLADQHVVSSVVNRDALVTPRDPDRSLATSTRLQEVDTVTVAIAAILSGNCPPLLFQCLGESGETSMRSATDAFGRLDLLIYEVRKGLAEQAVAIDQKNRLHFLLCLYQCSSRYFCRQRISLHQVDANHFSLCGRGFS